MIRCPIWWGIPLAVVVLPAGAAAQLISPGRLSSAHVELEGIRRCVACHELGRRGSSDGKCLECHTPLRLQLDSGRGLHATYDDAACSSCHKEHLGAEFDVLRFDSLGFQHEETGHSLVGVHADAACRGCHTDALIRDEAVVAFAREHPGVRTSWLGLDTECVSCHGEEDPHFRQFEEECSSCHGEDRWVPATGFDHDQSRYPLDGAHVNVECSSCHAPSHDASGRTYVRYAPRDFGSCLACHEDEHRGQMGRNCTECHSTRGWTSLSSRFETDFDHGTTGFRLQGAHSRVSCAACHGEQGDPDAIRITFARGSSAARYPIPDVEGEDDCRACHIDEHEGELAGSLVGDACSSCHTDESWLPTTFDGVRHQAETSFALTGAHLATPCVGCHVDRASSPGEFGFSITTPTCRGCHGLEDPHGGQFEERDCADCHVDTSFRIEGFDHDATAYPLDGRHENAPCAACHRIEASGASEFVRYVPLGLRCQDCHGGS